MAALLTVAPCLIRQERCQRWNEFGEDIFFPKPGPPKLCTQQYGGPQVAIVTGSINGRPVSVTFRRTDGCEISRWRAMAPLLGGTHGSRGET